MTRIKTYESNAERQRAYRLRQIEGQKHNSTSTTKEIESTTPVPGRPPRYRSRPQRIAELQREAELLKAEYERWLNRIPEPLQDGEQANRLTETIEHLENVIDLLSEIEPPRGFGRD